MNNPNAEFIRRHFRRIERLLVLLNNDWGRLAKVINRYAPVTMGADELHGLFTIIAHEGGGE